WYLGWKERAAALLAANPAEVNRRYDEGGLTLLHIAAQKNDIALAEMALAAKPDVTITDNWHDSTPLGWARFFERKEIFEMIQHFEAQQKN
ncbi:MAG TPA: ankyrin repeat domain-containing protein, partial [Chitinophagaceae bacterium]|nr:ankyrin repeat domain-containing protein [Chitinophagaceae bacterium]